MSRGEHVDCGDQTVLRFVEANRASFDSPQPAPGAAERRVAALEKALLDTRGQAALLERQLHEIRASSFWRLTGPLRRILARLRSPKQPLNSTESAPPARPEPLSYERWIEQHEPACVAILLATQAGWRQVTPQRLGVVLLPGPDAAAALAHLIAICPENCRILALQGAHDPMLAINLPDHVVVQKLPTDFWAANAPGLAANSLDVDLLCFLDPRDRPATASLILVSAFTGRYPQTDIIFADEDWLENGKRVRPFFKPGWDGEWQRRRDLLGPFTFFRATLVRSAFMPANSSGAAVVDSWRHDLANCVAAATLPERIQHIPAVLCHRSAPPVPEAQPGFTHQLPFPSPLVSVIVPTRDRAGLLATCTDALLRRTDYPRMELVIIDNGSIEADSLMLLDRLAGDSRVKVLREPGPFNWSSLNNRGVRAATGEIVVLLNNDTDVLHPDWLSVLVTHAIQPGVGAVGAKLLYPDGRIQHAGLTTERSGIPRHLFRYADNDGAGPFGMMAATRQVWAVTGACLATTRTVFDAVGGLNEALPVAYNDVEFCLRLNARGFRILWTPEVVLEHCELATRPPDHLGARREQTQEELNRLVRDWGPLVLHDIFLNPNLHLEDEQLCFGAAAVPSVLS